MELLGIEDATVAGLALMTLYIVIKEVVKPLLEKGKPTSNIDNVIASKIQDLHRWHAPDESGEQSWKNKRLEQLLVDQQELTRESLKEHRRHNSMLESILRNQEDMSKEMFDVLKKVG